MRWDSGQTWVYLPPQLNTFSLLEEERRELIQVLTHPGVEHLSQDVKPVKSPPVSADPAGFAKTREREQEGEKERERLKGAGDNSQFESCME